MSTNWTNTIMRMDQNSSKSHRKQVIFSFWLHFCLKKWTRASLILRPTMIRWCLHKKSGLEELRFGERLWTHPNMFPSQGTDPGKEYISLYRSLTGVWIIFGLGWLALILNIGARIMENVIILTHPGFKKQEEDEDEEVSSSKLEDTSKI